MLDDGPVAVAYASICQHMPLEDPAVLGGSFRQSHMPAYATAGSSGFGGSFRQSHMLAYAGICLTSRGYRQSGPGGGSNPHGSPMAYASICQHMPQQDRAVLGGPFGSRICWHMLAYASLWGDLKTVLLE